MTAARMKVLVEKARKAGIKLRHLPFTHESNEIYHELELTKQTEGLSLTITVIGRTEDEAITNLYNKLGSISGMIHTANVLRTATELETTEPKA
jgi:hypothetical protein